MISKEDMIALLNTAMKHERKHFGFYLQAGLTLQGVSRLYLGSFLKEEMKGELEHIHMFGEKIVAMGGVPTTDCFSYPENLTTSGDTLRYARDMEREVLAFYHEIYPKAEEFADHHKDMSIVLLLEEQIEDSTHDVEEIEKMLLGT